MLSLKSVITIFSKAHDMSCLHIHNFTIKVALRKTFASVSNKSSPILVIPSCLTNDKIYTKKTFLGPSKNSTRKRKKKQEVCDDLCVCVRKCFVQDSTLPRLVAISLVKCRYNFINLSRDQPEVM